MPKDPWDDDNEWLKEIGESDPLRQLRAVRERLGVNFKPVVQHYGKATVSASFRAYRFAGKVGEKTMFPDMQFTSFKPRELFATDTAARPGFGTRLVQVWRGNDPVFTHPLTSAAPTWMWSSYVLPEERADLEKLAALVGTDDETEAARGAATRLRLANAAAKFDWKTWQAGIPTTFEIEFLEDCAWEAVFWGQELS